MRDRDRVGARARVRRGGVERDGVEHVQRRDLRRRVLVVRVVRGGPVVGEFERLRLAVGGILRDGVVLDVDVLEHVCLCRRIEVGVRVEQGPHKDAAELRAVAGSTATAVVDARVAVPVGRGEAGFDRFASLGRIAAVGLGPA